MELAGTCVAFAIVAVICWTIVILIRAGRFKRNRWLGIDSDRVRASEQTWTRAHRAAQPWIVLAGVTATIAFALGFAAIVLGPDTPAGGILPFIGIGVGFIGCSVGIWMGYLVGTRAAKR